MESPSKPTVSVPEGKGGQFLKAMAVVGYAVQNERMGYCPNPTLALYIRHWREGRKFYLFPRQLPGLTK
jgi:hypothetical protein